MRALVLCSGHNSEGRQDATGAFIPKAREFARIHGLHSPVMFDHRQSDAVRERGAEAAIAAAPRPLECFAYFGHGVSRGLSSLGFTGPADTQQFADALRPVSSKGLVVLLYACSAANRFAPDLARQLEPSLPGIRVFGHTTAAHTTRNPFMKRFPGDEWIVAPHSSKWRAWRAALRHSRLWAVFPWLTNDELGEALDMPVEGLDRWLDTRNTIPSPAMAH